MLCETFELKVDYKKAGIEYENLKPTLSAYCTDIISEIGTIKRPAIIICPGGAYDYCTPREGAPVAIRYAGFGINAFVLDYSCHDKCFPTQLLELGAAVKFVKENADRWDIDKDKIFVSGFSAGGHLAASYTTYWNSELLTSVLGCEAEDLKIKGSVLCYAVISTEDAYTHDRTCANLVGKEVGKVDLELKEMACVEKHVSKDTPPAFLWHTSDDGAVPVENALLYMMALKKYKIPFEAHIYPHGNHGISLADLTTSQWEGYLNPVCANWFEAAKNWILRQ